MSNIVSARRKDMSYITSVGPDVCWTPFGPLMLPVAYNSCVNFEQSTRTSATVRNNGCQDFQLNSRAFSIEGHEAGVGKGVFHQGHVKAYAMAKAGSQTVFSEGWQVVRDGDPAWINRPDTGQTEPQRGKDSVIIEHQ